MPDDTLRALRRTRTTLARLGLAGLVALSACGDSPTNPGTGPDPDPQPTAYDHARATGASAADLLSGADFDSLVVQVQYVEGHRPTDAGLQALRSFMEARLNKPRGIEIRIEPALQITQQATYSVADVRALEAAHRTAFTQDRTLAIYFIFLNGEFSDQANVLGFAHLNTSMAIFQEKIDEFSGGIGQPSQALVEGVVLKHEIGHNLGLVNNGSTMQVEHQDEPNGKHCDDPDCLMYYAVRTSDFISNLLGGEPELDPDCLDDLQANGGK